MTSRQEDAANAEREAVAIWAKIGAVREHDGPLVPDGFEADAERASDLMRRARRVRAEAAPPPPRPLSPAPAALPKKEIPPMTPLPPNVLRAEKQRCLGIIAEAARLGVPGDILDAAIRGGTSVEQFTAENDVAGALAAEIVASAKAGGR